MNKFQRTKTRIERDKNIKAIKQENKNKTCGNFERVITYQNYLEALGKCRCGVSWKGSVQVYTENSIIEISNTIKELKSLRLPKLSSCRKITLYERGKERTIVPITIRDRMTQRVICDKSLIPMLCDSLIYDNGASTKGKGVDFTRKRVEKHLREAIKEYGADNLYALIFDFKSFFDSIPHKTCLEILKHTYTDNRMIGLIMSIIRSYQRAEISRMPNGKEKEALLNRLNNFESRGICLGSQISQIMALVVPNKLDHYVKDKMSVRHYIRYMDDGLVLSNDKKFLARLLEGMIKVAEELGLKFNAKKTRIVKMTKGITFMKIKYCVTKNGMPIKRLTRAGIVRMRRKLKRLRNLVDKGIITLDDVYNSFQSWLAHSHLACSYKTRKSMLKLYNELFDGYRITKKFWYLVKNKIKRRNVPYEFLQADKWERFRWSCNA